MRPAIIIRSCLIAMLLLLAFGSTPGQAAPLSQADTWNITSPVDGAVLNGAVTIVGTASHHNFGSYGLLYAAGPTPTGSSQWLPIVMGVSTMVVNGTLGTWDTTGLPDGQYTLALAVYETGNQTPNLFFVNNLTINNSQVAPTETETPTETVTTEATEAPTVDPAGAPVATVEQPPTVTPRPAPTTGTEETGEDGSGKKGEALLSVKALQEAFCSGAWIAVMIYILWGLYLGAKLAWRYSQRKPGGTAS